MGYRLCINFLFVGATRHHQVSHYAEIQRCLQALLGIIRNHYSRYLLIHNELAIMPFLIKVEILAFVLFLRKHVNVHNT